MDPIMLVAKMPPTIVDAVSAYRMLAARNDIDSKAFQEANSMFVIRTFGSLTVDELQRAALRSDAEYTLALINLVRAISREAEQVDDILAEWQSGHPGVFKK